MHAKQQPPCMAAVAESSRLQCTDLQPPACAECHRACLVPCSCSSPSAVSLAVFVSLPLLSTLALASPQRMEERLLLPPDARPASAPSTTPPRPRCPPSIYPIQPPPRPGHAHASAIARACAATATAAASPSLLTPPRPRARCLRPPRCPPAHHAPRHSME